MMTQMSRRDLIKRTGMAAAGIAALGLLNACGGTRATTSTQTHTVAIGTASQASLPTPGASGLLGVLDVSGTEIPLTATTTTHAILPGKNATLMVYTTAVGGWSYINPIFRVQTGQSFAATLANNLDERTNIHWHGLQVEGRMDGHPSLSVAPGASTRYAFTVRNRGGMYWYHPHADGTTAKQAYSGLASLFLVEDDDERALAQALDLRFGETDIPLVLQDKQFDASGKLVYAPQPMDRQMGWYGDVPLVNLTPSPTFMAKTRLYRFRLLNGANARIFRLAFLQRGATAPFTLIGTDGGLLARPAPVRELFLAPGERADVLLDLRAGRIGDTITLQSLAFDPMDNEMGMGGMGMGRMHHMDGTQMAGTTLPNGTPFPLLTITVTAQVAYDRQIPDRLSMIAPIDVAGANSRPFTLTQAMPSMQWLINGTAYRIDESSVKVQRASREIWVLQNATMSMPHPMHLHGFLFQVLERRGSPQHVAALGTDSAGRVPTDVGWKDTVLVWPGETVRLAIDFSHPFTGEQTYLLHCHNLEHEEGGMMLNYTVG